MTDQYENKLGNEKILPLIIKMSIPAVIAQLVNMLYSLVDRIYIGRIPQTGTLALAGIGISSSIIILISAFAAFISGGGAPLAAIALGAGDRKKAEKILGNGMTLLFIFSLFCMLFTYLYMKPLLILNGASCAVLPFAMQYLRIYMIGTLFVQISTGLTPFINAQGRPGIAMAAVLIGAVSNIILDPIFIFGLHLGVSGAAVATVISQFFSALWVISFLTGKKASLPLRLQNLKPELPIIQPILALGISSFIMASTESLIGLVLNRQLAKFGDIYVSTLTVLQSALQMVGVPLMGFAQGFAPVMSYNYGQGNEKRVRESFKVALTIMFTFNFVAILLIILLRRFVAGMFTSDPALIAEVCRYATPFLFGMSIFGLQRTCQQTFVSLGRAKVSIFIALLRKIILLIPLSLILAIPLGVLGVYLAEGIADAAAAILCTIIFSFQFPKILKKMHTNS